MKLGPLHIDGFLAAMLSAVALALLAPQIGRSDGPLHLGPVTGLGIALVFLLHGANLAPDKLLAGMRNWRLHLFVQACTFVLFPLIGVALATLLDGHIAPALLTGVFFLCVLPSTISSSVAFTAMAGGNVPAAVFNATLSNFIGILVTPLLVSQWLHVAGGGLPVGQAILSVAVQLLLPFIVGQFLRPHVHAWLSHHKPLVNRVDRGVIVLIVYSSFSDSAAAGLWSGQGWITVLQALGLAAAILAGVLSITRLAARRLGFSPADEVVAVFCGSKKSVASGIPMARLLFGTRPELGLIVLPAMLYHQVQLLVCAALARRYARALSAPGAGQRDVKLA
jgi:solute carrier family 10 (sodium/bile acid cotransporter), member 7